MKKGSLSVMELHKKTIMPRGFKCASKNCGLKKDTRDLSVFYSEVRANAAGVFTKNKFPGAPIILGREIISQGFLRAIIVNSKVSNVGTGQQGIENARRMAVAVSEEFNIPRDEVIMSSTGVIGKQLPIEIIESGIQGISDELENDPIAGAKGIMTTDTYPKALSVSSGESVITIIGKGSGMIAPDMATMLVYIFTDADIESAVLDDMLREAADGTFNMMSVDTDTSTSDTCVIMANGLAGKTDEKCFRETLFFACTEMTKMLARDGEGATKLLLADISGAKTENEAKVIARSVINSPLIKTMAYGADPNIGRVLMAIGKCTDCEIQSEKIEIRINSKLVYQNESRTDFDEGKIRALLKDDPVEIKVNMNVGHGSAIAYGCDLTEGYIKENAAYYSS
ncbi:bifunctional glutamate N-acetyltransferase/amino-acid acetyltransferase ArgJ [Desulfococcaceae bacterium HSG8]|nr:bifunctional glutamate N-acetyltransferase/amino-acid acetyltransferase ArgJ [Desulfococcaceae bacterium HSG8]